MLTRQHTFSATKAACGRQARVSRPIAVRCTAQQQQDSGFLRKAGPMVAAAGLAVSLLFTPAPAQAGPPRSLESKSQEKQQLYQEQLKKLEALFEQQQGGKSN